MCGIAGIINFDGKPPLKEAIKDITDALRHRGPDDGGFYFDEGITLGHRRLSIIDLSPAGHQPICNEDETIWLTYNGEIYNYQELTSELKTKGHLFKSKTDSEVILHAYEAWNEECLNKFNGMWAFALWDLRKKQLFCARDRFGIKPFYYHLDNKCFLFASEIKALLQDKRIERSPNEQLIYDYLANASIGHSDETFFKGVKQLPAAHYLIVNAGSKQVKLSRYWDIEPAKHINNIFDSDASARFYEIFEDAIRLRLQSDVPLGTCLSGGLDSSSIVCVTNHLLNNSGLPNLSVKGKRQKTFSSCFEDKRFDERDFIMEVVKHTGVDAHYVFPGPDDLFKEINRFVWHQDEPVNDLSQYSQWCVMKLINESGVKVVLDGQGGDELLAGYHLFFNPYFEDLARALRWRQLIREADFFSRYHGYRYTKWMATMEMFKPFVPETLLRCRKWFLNDRKPQGPLEYLNDDFVAACSHKFELSNKYQGHLSEHLYRFLVRDRLPSLLRYEDRNSMAFSIEARLPFLDYRLVEFVFSLPNEQKIHNGVTKVVLRNAMKRIIPETIRNRMDKMGFATPQNQWLKTESASQVGEIFNSASFRQRPYFKPNAFREYYNRFRKEATGDSSFLWRAINLELWMRQFIDG